MAPTAQQREVLDETLAQSGRKRSGSTYFARLLGISVGCRKPELRKTPDDRSMRNVSEVRGGDGHRQGIAAVALGDFSHVGAVGEPRDLIREERPKEFAITA